MSELGPILTYASASRAVWLTKGAGRVFLADHPVNRIAELRPWSISLLYYVD